MGIVESIVVAASLCADCLAVSMCSSVTLRKVDWKVLAKVALSFAVIQAALLFIGWAFGNLFVGLISKISHIVGFLLLLYVGGSMLIEGIRNEQEEKDLNGWRNIIIGGIATSIDALAVGVAQSMAESSWLSFLPLLISVFVVTALSVIAGIKVGLTVGCKFGRWAEIAGGVVLIGIGVSILL